MNVNGLAKGILGLSVGAGILGAFSFFSKINSSPNKPLPKVTLEELNNNFGSRDGGSLFDRLEKVDYIESSIMDGQKLRIAFDPKKVRKVKNPLNVASTLVSGIGDEKVKLLCDTDEKGLFVMRAFRLKHPVFRLDNELKHDPEIKVVDSGDISIPQNSVAVNFGEGDTSTFGLINCIAVGGIAISKDGTKKCTFMAHRSPVDHRHLRNDLLRIKKELTNKFGDDFKIRSSIFRIVPAAASKSTYPANNKLLSYDDLVIDLQRDISTVFASCPSVMNYGHYSVSEKITQQENGIVTVTSQGLFLTSLVSQKINPDSI